MKEFTDNDIQNNRISADRTELVYDPLSWMKSGLQETASGYGKRLNTGYKISFNKRLFRLYCTCFGNSGTVWFRTKGRMIVVS